MSAEAPPSPPPRKATAAEIAALAASLPPDVVRQTIRAAFPKFRACYERALARDATTMGTVATRFIIRRDGTVRDACISEDSTTTRDTALRSCVRARFSRLEFPSPTNGDVLVTYPIDFKPE